MNGRFFWWLVTVAILSGLTGGGFYIVVTESAYARTTEDALVGAAVVAFICGVALFLYALARGGAPYRAPIKDKNKEDGILRRLG